MSGPVQTRVTNVTDVKDSAQSVKLNQVRAELNFAKRKIVSLQKELSSLKTAELLVLQRMNRYIRLEDTEQYYASDRYQTADPQQQIKPANLSTQDPDARIAWTQNKLSQGMEPMNAERDRLASEVKKVSQELRKYQMVLEKTTETLGVYSQEDQQVDNIAKRSYSEMFMLLQVQKKYAQYSTNSTTGQRQFSTDPYCIKIYLKLSDLFLAYSQRNPYVLNGDLKLNLDDPGDPNNYLAITNILDRLRQVMGNKLSKYDADLTKYSTEITSHLADPFKAKNLSTQPDDKRTPTPDQALNTKTKDPISLQTYINSTPGIDGTTGINILYDPNLNSVASAVTGWFNSSIKKLNGNKPFCIPKVQTAPQTQKDVQAQQAAATDKTAASTFSNKFSNTQAVIDPATIQSVFQSMYVEITKATADTSGQNVGASAILFVGNITYTGYILYHVRILNNARRAVDYINDLYHTGSLSQTDYLDYQHRITAILSNVEPTIPTTSS